MIHEVKSEWLLTEKIRPLTKEVVTQELHRRMEENPPSEQVQESLKQEDKEQARQELHGPLSQVKQSGNEDQERGEPHHEGYA